MGGSPVLQMDGRARPSTGTGLSSSPARSGPSDQGLTSGALACGPRKGAHPWSCLPPHWAAPHLAHTCLQGHCIKAGRPGPAWSREAVAWGLHRSPCPPSPRHPALGHRCASGATGHGSPQSTVVVFAVEGDLGEPGTKSRHSPKTQKGSWPSTPRTAEEGVQGNAEKKQGQCRKEKPS